MYGKTRVQDLGLLEEAYSVSERNMGDLDAEEQRATPFSVTAVAAKDGSENGVTRILFMNSGVGEGSGTFIKK